MYKSRYANQIEELIVTLEPFLVLKDVPEFDREYISDCYQSLSNEIGPGEELELKEQLKKWSRETGRFCDIYDPNNIEPYKIYLKDSINILRPYTQGQNPPGYESRENTNKLEA